MGWRKSYREEEEMMKPCWTATMMSEISGILSTSAFSLSTSIALMLLADVLFSFEAEIGGPPISFYWHGLENSYLLRFSIPPILSCFAMSWRSCTYPWCLLGHHAYFSWCGWIKLIFTTLFTRVMQKHYWNFTYLKIWTKHCFTYETM